MGTLAKVCDSSPLLLFGLFVFLFLFFPNCNFSLFSTPATITVEQNFLQYKSVSPLNTTALSWVSSQITVSGFPYNEFDSTTQVMLTMSLSHTNPNLLTVALIGPNGVGAIIGYSPNTVATCSNFYNTSVADNQTYQMDLTSPIPCPPPILTATGYFSTNLTHKLTAFPGSVPIRDPFFAAFQGNPVNGVWSLQLYSNSSVGSGTLSSWSLKFYSKDPCECVYVCVWVLITVVVIFSSLDACAKSPCLNGGTCVPNGWHQGNYTCLCIPAFSGQNCSYGVLGPNFRQFTSSTLFPPYSYYGLGMRLPYPASGPLQVSGIPPIDWTVAVVLLLNAESPEFGSLRITLQSPSGAAAVVLKENSYGEVNCHSLFGGPAGTPIFDNQTAVWGNSSALSLCSAGTMTAYGQMFLKNSQLTCFTPNCVVVSDPFTRVFENGPASGQWSLNIVDASFNMTQGQYQPPSYVTKWTLQFYCKVVFFLFACSS